MLEETIIRLIQKEVGSWPSVRLGIGDDAAIPPVCNGIPVVTTDAMVEGVHWNELLSPEDVGWKLVAVNISDLGAMGARPLWATLSISLPEPLDLAWVQAFASGLGEACRFFQLPLIGGDTTRSSVRTLVLTACGECRVQPILRSTGKPGDLLMVTGQLGRSAVAFLHSNPPQTAMDWFRRPIPPFAFGAALAESKQVHAMMDLSDGLLRDLERLCKASGCGARIDKEKIPGIGSLQERIGFGEDYELLVAIPPEAQNEVVSLAEMHHTTAIEIGVLTAEKSIQLGSSSTSWPAGLFAHFEEKP
jgi:thiamine-monophosphate kinase